MSQEGPKIIPLLATLLKCKQKQMAEECMLCFDKNCMYMYDSNLREHISDYLHINFEAARFLRICSHCLDALEKFHKFYQKIKKMHTEPVVSAIQNKEGSIEYLEDLCDVQVKHSLQVKLNDSNYLKSKIEKIANKESVANNSDSSNQLKIKDVARSVGGKESVRRKRRKVYSEVEQFYKQVECPACVNEPSHPNLTALRKHFGAVHKNKTPYLTCCKKAYKLQDIFVLRRHIQIHLDPKSCICDVCGKELSSPRLMKLHKDLHIPEPEKMLECKECNRKFGGKTLLDRHVKNVHEIYYTVCEICGKNFKKQVSFRAHLRRIHSQPKVEFVCSVCAKTYKSSSGLKQHMAAVHEEVQSRSVKVKQCSQCGKWMNALYIQKHVQRMHCDATPYSCPECDKRFKLAADLKSHRVVHSEDRPYNCTNCSSSFKTKQSLKSHMLQHSGECQVECPYCNKIISSSSNFIAHRKRMHSEAHARVMTEKFSQEAKIS